MHMPHRQTLEYSRSRSSYACTVAPEVSRVLASRDNLPPAVVQVVHDRGRGLHQRSPSIHKRAVRRHRRTPPRPVPALKLLRGLGCAQPLRRLP
jgi:hypothetical protein